LGDRFGFETRIVPPVRWRGRLVSSSGIRRAIEAGNVSLAARFLERPYALEGDVVSGHGIGAKQTVPTLNLRTSAQVLPLSGVYITRTADLDATHRRWNSITNVGMRPTFNGRELTIETFLLDPLDPPSPARIRVEFLERVREERKFDTPEALKTQILCDVARTQRFFARLQKWAPRALK
jgi:riboflavin kinase/FMN adenylyltransferase